MNFYASREFLETAAEVWFEGRAVAVEDVAVGKTVLRLLTVDGKLKSRLLFLDFHQPLAPHEVTGPLRHGGYVKNVVVGTVEHEAIGPKITGRYELAPYVDWSLFPHYEDYRALLQTRHKGIMRDRARRWRSLENAHGEIVFTMNDGGADVLPAARQWKSRQLLQTGLEDYFAEPKAIKFLERLREKGLLVSSTLRANGKLVSLWLGFQWQQSWSGWIFAYDTALRKYSPGHQLLGCMLEESHRLGYREFDFSEGPEDYKMIYATHARLLGEVGRLPLQRAAVHLAKEALVRLSPRLLVAVQAAKRSQGRSLLPILRLKPAQGA